MLAIRCHKIYTEQGCVDGYLFVKNGKIDKIVKTDKKISFSNTIDLCHYRILPGIIDIHVHGYQGCSALSTNILELQTLTQKMASIGVTAFLPTVGEHFENELVNLKLLSQVIDGPLLGARMLGIHMEGPFISQQKKGSFTSQQILPINIKKMNEYIKASHNHIKYICIAPELDPKGIFIKYLTDQKIIVSGGHTNANYEEYKQGIMNGICASTHTGNAMRQIDCKDVGGLGAALLNDIYCEVICDFHHLSKEMLQLILRMKGYQKMIMISDTSQLAGCPAGEYDKFGQKRIIDESGNIYLEDGTIACSSHTILENIALLKKELHMEIDEIIQMSSYNPSCLLKINNRKGSLLEGKDADFIVIDNNYQVIYTFVEGKCVYHKKDFYM